MCYSCPGLQRDVRELARSNRASRLVKTPKLHLGDTGLVCGLLGLDAASLAVDPTKLGPFKCTWLPPLAGRDTELAAKRRRGADARYRWAGTLAG